MTSHVSSQTHGIALFIDIENFIGDCSSLGLDIRLKPICQKLQEIAPVRLRRAYGDIIQATSSTTRGQDKVMANIISLRKELSSNMVTIEDIPYLQQHKNSADMILSSAALALAYEKPYLTHFAFVSNDKDYIPLYQKLREMGRFIIAICVDANNTSSRIIDAVDTLLYYEDLASLTSVIPRDPDQPNITETKSDVALQDSFALLVRAYKSLEAEGRTPVLLAQLPPKMQQIRADFDYSRLGFLKFLDFLAAAKEAGYIELLKLDNRGPTDSWHIELPAKAKAAAPQPATTEQKTIEELERKDNPQELIRMYTQALESRLKTRFPDLETRRRILQACIESQDALPSSLQDFSNRVADAASGERFKATDEDGKLVFKMLLSLYYARAFSIEYPSGDDTYNKHNPYLVSLIYQRVPELENRLEAHFAKTLKYHCKHLPRPEDLARLFYGEAPSVKQVQHCEEIIYEIRYW